MIRHESAFRDFEHTEQNRTEHCWETNIHLHFAQMGSEI